MVRLRQFGMNGSGLQRSSGGDRHETARMADFVDTSAERDIEAMKSAVVTQ